MAKEKVICDTDVLIDFWDAKSKRHIETGNGAKNSWCFLIK